MQKSFVLWGFFHLHCSNFVNDCCVGKQALFCFPKERPLARLTFEDKLEKVSATAENFELCLVLGAVERHPIFTVIEVTRSCNQSWEFLDCSLCLKKASANFACFWDFSRLCSNSSKRISSANIMKVLTRNVPTTFGGSRMPDPFLWPPKNKFCSTSAKYFWNFQMFIRSKLESVSPRFQPPNLNPGSAEVRDTVWPTFLKFHLFLIKSQLSLQIQILWRAFRVQTNNNTNFLCFGTYTQIFCCGFLQCLRVFEESLVGIQAVAEGHEMLWSH